MTLEHIVTRQRAAASPADAGRLTIAAGLDTEFPIPYGYGDALVGEVEAGRVDIAHVDRSVRRILTAKFRLGLFENPYPAERIEIAEVADEGRELSRELARRSVVLVKNDGLLPLAPGTTNVAVIGPHADAVKLQFPTYSYPAFRDMTTFMSGGGMGNMVGIDPGMAAWNDSLFASMPIEDFVRDRLDATSLIDEVRRHAPTAHVGDGSTLTRDLGDDAIAEAVAAATASDVVVLALGGASLWFNGERTEGEASDSADISLPAAQMRLAEAVAATGKPIVVVLVQGRAYTLPPVDPGCRSDRRLVVRRTVRAGGRRRRPVRRGEPERKSAVQHPASHRPDPGLPSPAGRHRIPQPAAARRGPPLPRHAGDAALHVRARTELHRVRARRTWQRMPR